MSEHGLLAKSSRKSYKYHHNKDLYDEKDNILNRVFTDRGSQYTSLRFQALLQRYSFQQSISRKGNPFDNAIMESFYRTLKRELVRDPTMIILNKLGWIYLNILNATIAQREFILHLADSARYSPKRCWIKYQISLFNKLYNNYKQNKNNNNNYLNDYYLEVVVAILIE